MLHDIPKSPQISSVEYADDIAVLSTGSSKEVIEHLQPHLDKIFTWAKSWGLEISSLKTKAMFFTNKKNTTPPPITLGGISLQYTDEMRYLGMTLDSPKFTWKKHVLNLRTSILPRINVLKTLSSKQWGADRVTLGNIYRAVVRSRLDYGSIFYNSVPNSTLQCLDKVQNICLRYILGAQKSSPISSLEVESNFPPLALYREELMLKNFCRIPEIPMHSDLWKDLQHCLNSNSIRFKILIELMVISGLNRIRTFFPFNTFNSIEFSFYCA